ncbi:MAG: hypothetical protein CVU54_03795 [Deltaproteobacteria bacterium HGW-Deltaproteobacteria-12]|jgi:hypothetical protein|nr:MAG: hypothetical protein CVU54_03795 [Deltaproteobacteria bacterium HGW-Deltaproteobacteria-12]
MSKDVTICFRTSAEIRNSLQKVADAERQTMSAVIDNMLYQYLSVKKVLQNIEKERRQYIRRPVSLPALVMDKNDEENKALQTGKVLDISLGGLLISIPRGYKLDVAEDSETNECDIIFTLPEALQPITMKCKTQRKFESEKDVQIGAEFVDSDFHSYQTLQKHLM